MKAYACLHRATWNKRTKEIVELLNITDVAALPNCTVLKAYFDAHDCERT